MNIKIALVAVAIAVGAGGWYLAYKPSELKNNRSTETTVNVDVKRKQFVRALRQLVEHYKTDHSDFPKKLQDLEPEYLIDASKFSIDPMTGQPLSYAVTQNGGREICAILSTGASYCETTTSK